MNFDSLQTLDLDDFDLEALEAPWDATCGIKGVEVDLTSGLDNSLSYTRTAASRTYSDLRANSEAVKHLEHIPGPGESWHGVISGKYALWDLVPATLERVETIENLTIATLSFSRQNAAELLSLVDTKRIGNVNFLISAYFKGTNREIYDSLIPQLIERGHNVSAVRSHCKITLMKIENDYHTIESSANLRSGKSLEQFVWTNDKPLYDFHYSWISELIGGRGIHGWKSEA